MVVVKPTGKDGKPLKPKPIKPKKRSEGGMTNKKPMKPKRVISIAIGKAKDYPGMKKILEMNKKGKKRFSKGGGADTGDVGEARSKLGVAINKIKRTGVMGKRPKPKLQAPKRAPMKPLSKKLGAGVTTAKKMGGGMMKYSKGGGADTGKRGEAKSKATIQNMRLERAFPLTATLAYKAGLTKKTTLPIKGKHKKMGGGMMKYKKGGSSDFGMLSVKAGIDKNPNPTQADRIAGAKMNKKADGGMMRGYGAARTSGSGLQDEKLVPGKSMDYYKDLM